MKMRVGTEIPEIGTTWDWDIDEILERASNDLDMAYVSCDCGSPDCGLRTTSESWELLLEERREDRWFEAVEASLATYGFTVPLTARVTNGVVALGDGHHRLAAAIDAGMTTVPVIMAGRYSFVSADSCNWADDIEYHPVDGEPILPPPPTRVVARDGTLIFDADAA